ncbi:uromodulin [Nematostella vectensis]|uniref:uromodulin n=1 Tax=Nematostella vectensis TaxID=45351 RepID=UPI002077530C|nr:uromodulin [Nematostella vectensis]
MTEHRRKCSVSDGVVTRTVCFRYSSCCDYSQNVNVRNCGGFYIYEIYGTPTCYLRYCGNGGECNAYTPLRNLDRSVNSHYNSNPNGDSYYCDNGLSRQWYRITGEAGYAIPTSCPRVDYCGTNYPGWLQGSHPSVSDGIVSRTVCFTAGPSSCCNWNENIRILNCGDFYVYELNYPAGSSCNLRFCGNGAASNCPCRNNGTCLIDESGGHCTCPVGYTGARCETGGLY